MFYRLSTDLDIGQHSNLSPICQGLLVNDPGMLFLVLKMLWLRICSLLYSRQAHCDWYECQILNVKLVVKYCND